jgi:hypothetical protein
MLPLLSREEARGQAPADDVLRAAPQSLLLSAERAPAMKEVLAQVQRLAGDNRPVWIHGEPGSGRRTAALALHALAHNRAQPIRFVHRGELGHVLELCREQSAAAWQAACDMLGELCAAVRGGTLVIDEGPGPDPMLQGLLAELYASRPGVRLILISQTPAGAASLHPSLRGLLGGRAIALPPLRQRREEIAPLCEDVLRALAPDTPGADTEEGAEPGRVLSLSEEAAALLREQPFHGNLWQLQHALRWIGRRAPGPTITAEDLAGHLPGHPFDRGAGQLTDGDTVAEVAQALGELLGSMLPIIPAGIPVPGPAASPEEELPWSPLLLVLPEGAEPGSGRLVLGPAPMDERRLVAGLQARPRGPGGARTGDAKALSRLGLTWRGHLLALLRAAYKELDEEHVRSLGLVGLGRLLILAGPPVSPDKLVRLALGQPVDLQEEETVALTRRLWTASGASTGGASHSPCIDPALGRSWADAVRGLLGDGPRDLFLAHADECARCTEALLAWWRVPGLLDALPAAPGYAAGVAERVVEHAAPPLARESRPGPGPRAPGGGAEADAGEAGVAGADEAWSAAADAGAPALDPALDHDRSVRSVRIEASAPAEAQPDDQTEAVHVPPRHLEVGERGDRGEDRERERGRGREKEADPAPADRDRGARPPALRTGHFVGLALLIAAALLVGTFFGMYLERRSSQPRSGQPRSGQLRLQAPEQHEQLLVLGGDQGAGLADLQQPLRRPQPLLADG